MENLTMLDIGILALILFLSLKGLINGFFKELFGLVGIIGGIFVGSRWGYEAGIYVNDNFLHLQNESVITVTGFLVVFIGFWFGMTLVGGLFSSLSSRSGLGAVDKLLGLLFSGTKIFFIISVIAHALLSIKVVREKVEDKISDSQLIPHLQEVGAYIVNGEYEKIVQKAENESGIDLDKAVEKVKEALPSKEEISDSVDEITNQVKEKLENQ